MSFVVTAYPRCAISSTRLNFETAKELGAPGSHSSKSSVYAPVSICRYAKKLCPRQGADPLRTLSQLEKIGATPCFARALTSSHSIAHSDVSRPARKAYALGTPFASNKVILATVSSCFNSVEQPVQLTIPRWSALIGAGSRIRIDFG